jgi:DNA-directed RNA polymerase specialized sigma24 family protein
MKKGWILTQESFDTLLDWLDQDRERAGYKYESIRVRLIKIFTARGCAEPDELADETFNRVTSKLHEVASQWQGDPALYCYKVAQYVFQEWVRTARRWGDMPEQDPSITPPLLDGNDDADIYGECLVKCMAKLQEKDRTLVIEYHQPKGRAKIERHKHMAFGMGIAANALRIRACRIRRQLKNCVQNCVEASPNGNDFKR